MLLSFDTEKRYYITKTIYKLDTYIFINITINIYSKTTDVENIINFSLIYLFTRFMLHINMILFPRMRKVIKLYKRYVDEIEQQ